VRPHCRAPPVSGTAHADRARGACHDPNTWPPRTGRRPVDSLRRHGRNPRGVSRSDRRTKPTDARYGAGDGQGHRFPDKCGRGHLRYPSQGPHPQHRPEHHLHRYPGRPRAGRWQPHEHRFRHSRHADHVGWRCWRSGVRTQRWPDEQFRPLPASDRRQWHRAAKRMHDPYWKVTQG
jgi:hypothetical protein